MNRCIWLIVFLTLLVCCNKVAPDEGEKIVVLGQDRATPLPEAVDLGIVVDGQNVRWASFNLGARDENEAGYHFPWGSRYGGVRCTYKDYDWKDEDAAAIRLGPGWRLPKVDDFKALIATRSDGERYVWEYIRNPVCGYRITFKTNGNHIFLPFAGMQADLNVSEAGTRGYYWASSISVADNERADILHIDNMYSEISTHVRYYGLSIRPVISD